MCGTKYLCIQQKSLVGFFYFLKNTEAQNQPGVKLLNIQQETMTTRTLQTLRVQIAISLEQGGIYF